MEEDNSKRALSHFLENRNYPAPKKTQRKKRAAQEDEEEERDSLAIVDGQVVMAGAGNKEREAIVEDRITALSYGKPHSKRTKWTKEDTILFYRALRLCGTDFTMLEKIFTDKERKQIKNKFTKEEKDHPEKISSVLKSSQKFSKEELEKLKQEYIDSKMSR